ncbi:MAG: ABC transporter permease [Anaerolineales bacterium]|jgi:ribose/xylose/arabinose/galactoside ABC-type transport system permease subunit
MDWIARILPTRTKDLSQEGSGRDFGRKISRYILPLVFLAWLVFLSISVPVFLSWQNLSNVSRQVAVVGLLSLGQLAVILTGNIDLSSASLMGLFGAVLAGQSKVMPFPFALAIGLILAVIWGFANGFLVTRGKNISVIVTLSTMYMAQGLLLIYTQGRPVILFPMPYEFLGIGSIGPLPWSLITFTIVAGIIGFLLRYKPVGRHVYAVGGNREAALVCGIDVKRLIISVYVISAIIASLAGLILLARVASAQPNAGMGMELDSIAAVLIGGASVSGGYGSVVGTIVGVFMLGFINNGLNLLGVSGYYQYVFKGAIILIAVIVETLQHRGS